MPLFYRLGRSHSPSRRNAIILPQGWDVYSSGMPSLSNYQDSVAGNQTTSLLTFYYHSNQSTTTLVPRRLSHGSTESRVTFFESDSNSSASSSRRVSSPPFSHGRACRPKPSWERGWPFLDGDIQLDYSEFGALGHLRAHVHGLNDISLSADRTPARLEPSAKQCQWAQRTQRFQTLGERRVVREVKSGRGIINQAASVKEAQSAGFVGFAEGEAEERIRISNADASKCDAAVDSWSIGFFL